MNTKTKIISIMLVGAIALLGVIFFVNQSTPTPPLKGIKALPTLSKVVILVPGHGGNQQSVQDFSNYLQSKSWKTHILNIGTGREDLESYGNLLKQKILEYNAQGASVNIVGYSAGGVIARIALADPTIADKTARVATVASPHRGTKIANLGQQFNSSECGTACQQLATDSELLSSLPNAAQESDWLSLFIENDEAVRPTENAQLNDATNLNISEECSNKKLTHSSIIKDPTVFEAVETFFYSGVPTVKC